jgi:selenocysteine lyase/cysteine desulfurase
MHLKKEIGMKRDSHYRSLYTIPHDVSYLNTAYMAPQLKSVTQAGLETIPKKEHPWNIGVEAFFAPVEALRREASQLFACGPDDVAIVPSVSYGIGVAAHNLPSRKKGEILVLAEQFPSNVYPWQARAQATEETVVFVARKDHEGWTEALMAAISSQTTVIAIPGCHWTDGTTVDLETVSQAAKEVGASLVLDLTQSLGAVPFSVKTVDPDFVVSAGYKWLLGPYSLGYMYVAPRHQKGTPLENNWITREDSHQFAGLVDYRDRYEPGARRYDIGERSNFFLLPMALAALGQLNQWGVESISSEIQKLTQSLIEGAEDRGWEAPASHHRSPHMVGIRKPGGLPDNVLQSFREHGVHVSVRGDSVRVSPHLHNTEEDLMRFFQALDKI